MGIQVEFNPDLALRNISHHKNGTRLSEECIPESLVEGNKYHFLKEGQRNYWLLGEIPLVETQGGGVLSHPLASIRILESTHFTLDDKMYTKGTYLVVNTFSSDDPTIHFNGFQRL